MRTKYIGSILGIISLISLSACKKDFLNIVPLGSQVASTTNDYDQLMNDPSLYYFNAGGGWQELVLMGDEVGADATYFNQGSAQMINAFQWKDDIFLPTDGMPVDCRLQLSSLYQCNKVIAEVASSTGGTDLLKAQVKAEAMATRAWINFEFINFYAKPYLASTAATDPGWPIIDQANVSISNYQRASVQAVYDFMIKDLTSAIADLPVKAKILTRMSRPAAEGLLGKIYMFMGRYNDAVPLFNAALADVKAAGVPVLYDYNTTLAPGGPFLPIDPSYGPKSPGQIYTDITESVVSKIFNNGPYSPFSSNPLGSSGLVLAPWAAALYTPADLRLKLYSDKNLDGSAIGGGRLRKYGVQWSRCGLQLADLYLLSAECKARLNDLDGAKKDVESLRMRRMPMPDAAVPVNIASSQTALIKFVIEERIREFAMEGARWFDMRRLSVDPLFAGTAFKHVLYDNDAGNTTTYTMNQPNRLTLRIPPAVIGLNPGMANNQ
ncbi:RagB/SusD family nutrient uptake outer membrane protein [Chitinophaga arvensicola]|uniref:SusD family protein n=1 Tax=Chitinophaga arvensicola TaxID=29529 RepID=A0A1I0RAN6_9BACT|nr:RagB/SusD family nutrient uptake outer membrane protein [Chitinophaga arvensicola]SEW37897.1 SusD family protein [Chitinophaga arvensicola]